MKQGLVMPGLDFPDPFASFDPFSGGGGRRPLSQRAPRAEFRQPLPPEEYQSVARQALNAGTSGIGYILGSLDKPGQAVRGVLAGKGVSALGNLVPFSDTMGLTTDADKTSGRDLTDTYGITDKNSKGWGAWGAGLAADIATDPFTYATLGPKTALTGLGSALKKSGNLKGMSRVNLMKGFEATEPAMLAAGKTASDVAYDIAKGKRIATQSMVDAAKKAGHDIVPGQPLASLASIGVPFGPKLNVGTGALAQKAAVGLDKAGDWIKFGNPIGRSIGSKFNSKVGEAVDAVPQRGFEKHGYPAKEALEAQARESNRILLEHLDPLIREGKYPEHVITEAARAVAEGVPHGFGAELEQLVTPAAEHIRAQNARYLNEGQDYGILKGLKDKYINYGRRQAIDVNHRDLQLGAGSRDSSGLYPVFSGANIARDPVLTNVPGGTNRINDWMRRFAGTTADVTSDIRKDLESDFLAKGRQMTPDIAKEFDDKAVALAGRIKKADPKHMAVPGAPDPLPFFSPDKFADEAQRAQQHARTMTAAKAAIGTIGDAATTHAKGSTVSVPVLLKKMGFKNQGFDKDTGTLARGALLKAYEALAPKGAENVDTLLNLTNKEIVRKVGQFGVPLENAKQILKSYRGWKAPEQIKADVNAFDSLTNAFKALVYPVWLPSHVRNAGTATLNNTTRGTGPKSYLDQLHLMTGLMKNRELSGYGAAIDALPVAERANAIRRAQYASAGIYGGHNASNEIAGNAAQALGNLGGPGPSRFTPMIPGEPGVPGSLPKDTFDTVVKQGLLGSLKASGKTALGAVKDPLAFAPWNWGSGRASNVFSPLGIRGVNGAAVDSLPAVAAGRKIGTKIEDFFRGALWNHEVRKGASPEVAASEVNRLHFNYDNVTNFERNVMRRLVPFYTFTRQNLPLQVSNVVNKPGVFNAQYKPFNQQTPGEDRYVPGYMASGVSVPLGPAVDGNRQYISKLGLPAEEAFERMHFKNGLPDIRATALDYMGAINPLIKAPLEQLFNTQFHTQRKLTDLKSQGAASAIGRAFGEDNPQLLSQVLANSPISRFVSSADKLMDPRKSAIQKAVNMMTGVRVTDVDIEKQKAIELRSEIEKLMEGHPGLSKFARFYVKPEDAAKLTPEEIRLMRAYSQLGDQAQAYAKKKREEAERIGVRP